MRASVAGNIAEGIWYFGREESGIYLLENESTAMIISGGMSWIVADVLEQMEHSGIDESRITSLLILHAHFDHVGLVPFFKRRLPHIEIYASAPAWETVGNRHIVEGINRYNRAAAEQRRRADLFDRHDLDWRSDVAGQTVRDEDVIHCGSLPVRIIAIPGHSPCSIAAYVPGRRALFASDGGGIPFNGAIIPSGNADYTRYQRGLERLDELAVELFCADHGGYVAGEEARRFTRDSITAARDFRNLMERVYRRTGSVEGAVRRLLNAALAVHSDHFLPREILQDLYTRMVSHVAAELDESDGSTGVLVKKNLHF